MLVSKYVLEFKTVFIILELRDLKVHVKCRKALYTWAAVHFISCVLNCVKSSFYIMRKVAQSRVVVAATN